MFKKNFVRLCNQIGKPPTTVCIELGLNKATFSNWREDSIPHARTLEKIADYFNVSTEDLIRDEQQNAPTPTRSECEDKILQHFRELSPEGQQALIKVVESMKKSSDKAQ